MNAVPLIDICLSQLLQHCAKALDRTRAQCRSRRR